jgi:hypothetical protein
MAVAKQILVAFRFVNQSAEEATGARSLYAVWPVLLVTLNGRKDIFAASCDDQGAAAPSLAS